MRYKTPTTSPITVKSNNGKTAVVGPEFAELAEEFHAAAEAQGCIAETPGAAQSADAARRNQEQQLAGTGDGSQQQAQQAQPQQAQAPEPAKPQPSTGAGRATTKGKHK